MYTIVTHTPSAARELQRFFAASDRARRKAIKAACTNGQRYVVIDAGFPAVRWLVWDCEASDNLRGAQLNAKQPPRHPWFVAKSAAQRIADRLNAATLSHQER